VPEFALTLIQADELKAWTLAAAVGYLMKADTCFRLPGPLQLFVALTDVTEIAPDDPRAQRRTQDAEQAAEALREYAGPAALHLGTMLVEELKGGRLDPVVQAVHRVCERLEVLGKSPVGRDTPAAAEATELAGRLRQGAMGLSLPPGHPQLGAAVQHMLDLLEAVAKQHGAWPDDQADDG
jgi:hypothetical protein